MFGLILVYIIITLLLYLTQKHIAGYEVVEGTISGNYRYSAIALKEEQIEKSVVAAINKALADLQADGTMDALKQKWFGQKL